MNIRRTVWLFAAANVLLYASVLPLWEGFDEPFHYSYVQYLWTQARLPVIGATPVSEEVWNSLHAAPASYLIQRNLPFVETFGEWFRRGGPPLKISGDKHSLVAGTNNYEAQQAPLAYMILAVPDMALSHVSLPLRVWVLRVLCGGASIGLLVTALMRVTDSPAAWLCALCVQMLYATTVHISNDWLAVGLAAWFFVGCVERRVWIATVAVTLGLLTKAYFLAFVPVLIWRFWPRPAPLALILVAAPVYIRNLMLYGNVSGVFISTPRVSLADAAASIDWLDWLDYIGHSGVWTANNSFTSFSRLTIDVFLILVVAAFAIGVRNLGRESYLALACITAVGAALIYSTIMLRAYTGGQTIGTGPWYTPLILVPVVYVAFAGTGRAFSAALVAVSAYIIVLTYWIKLIPMYGGLTVPRATIPAILSWYRLGRHTPAYLASWVIVYVLAAVVTVLALWTGFLAVAGGYNDKRGDRIKRSPLCGTK